MSPQYKLTYFNIRGVAEPIRYLLKYGNIEFEDIRIDQEKDWPTLKPKTPFGVLPLLEIDGIVYGESVAIARYVGQIVGLGGKTDLENLKIDSIMDSYKDFVQKIGVAFREEDLEKKKQLFHTLRTEHLPFYFSRFEEIVKKNGYLGLDRLTWADVLLIGHIPLINKVVDVNIDETYPSIGALIKKVENIPQIKKWIETRPVTER